MKIINRRLFKIKMGKMQEAAAMVRDEVNAVAAEGGYSGPGRIYLPHFAPENILAVEWEYESLAAYESQWAEYGARPETAEFQTKFGPLRSGPGHNEIRYLLAANEVEGSQNNIAVRWVKLIKPEAFDDIQAATVAEFVTPGEWVARLSRPETGWFGEQTLEIEYESLTAYEDARAEWSARPTTGDFVKILNAGLREGGRTEVWEIYH